jgi:hypothetical protein
MDKEEKRNLQTPLPKPLDVYWTWFFLKRGPRRGCWVVFVFSEGRVRAGVCTLRSTSTFRPELE